MEKADDSGFFTAGSTDFSSGVDSLKCPTELSASNPNGLSAHQLSWLVNATVRTGGIEPRDGWVYRGQVVSPGSLEYLLGTQFQGKTTYVPQKGDPYEIWVVGGHIIKIDPTFATTPQDLSVIDNLIFSYPGTPPKVYFCQAGPYLVIQAGDFNPNTGLGTLPFFWDGSTLTQSNGLTGIITGYIEPVQYGFTPITPGFIVPAVGSSVTFNVNVQYAGLFLNPLTLFTQASNFQENVGVFQVTAATSNTMTLKTVSLSGSTRGKAGAIIATACVLESTPSIPGNTVTGGPNPAVLDSGTPVYSPNYVPIAGNTQTWNFTGGVAFGMPLNSYQVIFDFSLNVLGVVQVTDIGSGAYPTYKVTWLFSLTPGAAMPTDVIGQQTYITPAIGSSITLPTNTRYGGNVNDYVFINGTTIIGNTITEGYQFGTFEVTTINDTSIVLKMIYTTAVGQAFLITGINVPQQNYTISSNTYQTTGSGLVSQLPAAGPMSFYMGRIFYAQGKTASGGDIQGGSSGTLANSYLDSVLCVTENPLCSGGDGFTMPAGSDNITGLAIPQMINAGLGEGLLNIGTPNWVFALQVPVSRADWKAADSTNQPQVFVIQSGTATGFVNDWDVLPINGDLWYTSPDAEIHSLATAVRYFEQWSNPIISSNEYRITSVVNTSLLNWTSSVYFDTRRLGLTKPVQTLYGVYFPAIIPLDLTTISTLETQNPPNWEGHWEGMNILKLDVATFGNQLRCFAAVLSPSVAGQMEIWELVTGQIGDQNATQNDRIQWQATLCSFTANKEFMLKELHSAELWLDNIQGVVDIEVDYCPDGSSCWYKWAAFSVCSAADNSQLGQYPPAYPLTTFQPGCRKPLQLPHPPDADSGENNRPAYYAYEFQPRITIKGECRLRGIRLHMTERKMNLYENVIATLGKWKSFFTSILGG